MTRLNTRFFGPLVIALLSVFSTAHAAEINVDKLAFQIESSKCYVGIAQVKLSVGTLTQVNGKLVGDYRIEVPLKKSKNDSGRIELVIDQCFEKIGEEGGTLRGFAYSEKDGKVDEDPSLVVCKIGPLSDKAIELAITTSSRTINFDSSYVLVETPEDS